MLHQRQEFRRSLENRSASNRDWPLTDLLVNAYTPDRFGMTLRSADPRDRIFGLLDLATDAAELGIRPDYNKTCEDVFTEAWAAILTLGQAALLAHPQYGRRRIESEWALVVEDYFNLDCETVLTHGGSILFERHAALLEHPQRRRSESGCALEADDTWKAFVVLLSGSSAMPEPFPGLELPFWVPDWLVIQHLSPSNQPMDRPYTACGDKKTTEWIATGDPRTIALKAVEVDVVGKTGTSLPLQDFFQWEPVSKLLNDVVLFLKHSTEKGPEAPLYEPKTAAEALWRIPVGDREPINGSEPWHSFTWLSRLFGKRPPPQTNASEPRYRRATSSSAKRYRNLLNFFPKYKQLRQPEGYDDVATMQENAQWYVRQDPGFKEYRETLMSYSAWRPFLTTRGYVGLGPAYMVAGDVVAIFYGLPVPFVLRPQAEEKSQEKGRQMYQLIGEAYVHGIMDGEFFREPRDETTIVLF
ncbi:hypothetical protein ACJ41O_013036 [Fusarium nematophilum]